MRLGDARPADRARLLARQVYRHLRDAPGDGEPKAREAAALARETRDARAIQEALYVLCFRLAGPDHLDEREALAREMIEAASNASLEAETIIAAIDVASDAMMRGAPVDAFAWRHEAGRLCGKAPPPQMAWHCQVFDAGVALMEGRLEEGQRLSESALSLGRRAGHPYAKGIHFSFQSIVAWETARFAEVVDGMIPFLRVPTAPLHWARGVAARAALRMDDRQRAIELYETALRDGVSGIPRGIRWTRSLIELAHACADLGDVTHAEDFVAALDEVPEQHGVLPVPICYGGPVRYARARVLAQFGEPVAALDEYVEALEDARRLRARPFEARILADHARLLERLGRTGHRELARSAERTAQACGITLFA